MRRAFARTLMLMCTVMACVVGPRALGQDPRVSVRVDAPQRMYLGDTAEMQVVVEGSRDVQAPDLSGMKDFEAVYRAPQDMSSRMTTIINGRVSTRESITYGHLYSITPRHAGQLEIPPLTVTVSGKAYTTAGVTVEVIEPKTGEGFKLELVVDHPRAFVGQPILVRLAWTMGKNVDGRLLMGLPIDGAEHDVMLGPVTRGLTQGTQNAPTVVVNGAGALASYDGANTLVLDRVVVPRQAGKITIGPARVDYMTVVGQRPRGPLDFPFDNRNITERQFSSAAPVEIMVDDLPAAGKPADFSGLVGKYEITATADATTVSVGEPINLMVGVAGPYPPTLVPAMDFSAQRDLKSHFRVPRDPVLAQTTATAAFFQAMIRARTDSVKAIDPISISYFDPDTRKYRVAKTGPLPITVKPSTTVGLPDEPEGAEPEKPAGPARPGGLPDIERNPVPFVGAARMLDVREEMRSVGTIAMLAGPPVACGLVAAGLGVARWRRRDPDGARRAAAVRKFKKAVRRPRGNMRPEDALARAIANFAADWYTRPVDTLTGPATAALLEAEGTEAGKTLGRIARACDEVRFAGTAGAVDVRAMGDEAVAAAREYGDQLRAVAKGRAA